MPEGYQPDHLCRNKLCVNPEHMEAVTPAENSRRSPSTKLTHEEVHTIRRLSREGATRPQLAFAFGVSIQTISDIRARRSWADLPD